MHDAARVDFALTDLTGVDLAKADLATADAAMSVTCAESLRLPSVPLPESGWSPSQSHPFSPDALVIGDFNADGNSDLASAEAGTGTVSVHLGRGDGTFAPSVRYSVGTAPNGLIAADLDGDGDLELITSCGSDARLTVLVGIGNGSFSVGGSYATIGEPTGLVADFSGDGATDVVVITGGANNVEFFLGNGDATFAMPTQHTTGPNPTAIVAADFDHDGRLDVATADIGGGYDVSVLLGDGQGSFASPIVRSTDGVAPFALVAADFDGDGNIDVAINASDVFRGNGNGSLQAGGGSAVPSASSLAATDVNKMARSTSWRRRPTRTRSS